MADKKKEMSQREIYERDFAAMNPDLDMNDEEAVYGARNSALGKLKKYDESTSRLKSVVGKSPILQDAITAASEAEGDDFDFLRWLGESKGVDIKQALEDPEYAAKVTEGYKQNLADKAAQEAESAERDKKFNDAAGKSFEEIYSWDEGRKVSAEKTKENIQKMFEAVDNFVMGNYLPLYQLFTKGASYDTDVDMARNEGRKDGLGQKVAQKLANTSEGMERNGGRQQPVPERKPKPKKVNPYIEDEDEF